jgi:hypothetical protein
LPSPFEGKCAAAVSWRRPGKCRRPPASFRSRGIEEAAPSSAGPTTSRCRRPQRPRAFARSDEGGEGRRGFARAHGHRRCTRGGRGARPRWIRKEEEEVTAPRSSCTGHGAGEGRPRRARHASHPLARSSKGGGARRRPALRRRIRPRREGGVRGERRREREREEGRLQGCLARAPPAAAPAREERWLVPGLGLPASRLTPPPCSTYRPWGIGRAAVEPELRWPAAAPRAEE